jgi:hypothetical protein
MRSLGLVLLAALAPIQLEAQESGGAAGARPPASVSGLVYDSIGKAPLVAAAVEMAGAAGNATGLRFATLTDSLGRWRLEGLPAGTYAIAFNHPVVDSLGFEINARAVTLRPSAQRLDLATPSATTVLKTLCGARSQMDSTGLLIGHVRDAESELPLDKSWVVVRWMETIFDGKGVRQRERALSATSVATGWFGICGVPSDVPVLSRAGHGPDSSGYVPIEVPSGGLRYVSLFVGNTKRVAVEVTDSAERAAGTSAMMAWRGRAHLNGSVVDRAGKLVPNARVIVIGSGMETLTNDAGRFSLDSLPAGTQTLDVRAIGYVPIQRIVNLAERSPTTVDVTLGDRAIVLSKVQVRGTPVYSSLFAPKLAGFFDRMRDRKLGLTNGYFITPQDIENRKPVMLTQMFETLPSVHVAHGGRPSEDRIVGRRNCAMTIFLDGVRVVGKIGRGAPEEGLNNIISPNQVAAMEVYADAFDAPPQYQPQNASCGVVLVWSK